MRPSVRVLPALALLDAKVDSAAAVVAGGSAAPPLPGLPRSTAEGVVVERVRTLTQQLGQDLCAPCMKTTLKSHWPSNGKSFSAATASSIGT